MVLQYHNLSRIQKHISSELDKVIRRHQKELQAQINFTLGKKAPSVSYIFASKNLARKMNGGATL